MLNINIGVKTRNLFLLIISAVGLIFFVLPAKAQWASHLVISEVQITGGAGETTNDFIELYNPTENVINLNGYRLVKRTKIGTSDTLIKSWTDDVFVPVHGFFLWANSDYVDISVTPDTTTSVSIANDNGVAIRLGPNDTGEIIDSLGWGDCQNIFVETSATSTLPVNPDANQSLERKPGGEDGNGEDTNDNYNDFFLQISPNPQNLQSTVKPSIQGPVCGNSICEAGEDSISCLADCPLQAVCGNNIIEADEQCDGSSLAGQNCVSRGFVSGSLRCSANCTFDTSACMSSGGGGGYSSPPTYQPQAGDIVINEIFPEPDGQKVENEWIEIYNKTNQAIDLSDWTIEDNTHNPKNLTGVNLAARSYFVLIKATHFSFALNNSGDVIILKKGNTVIDQVAYGDFEDGNLDDNAPRPGKSKSIGRNSESLDTNNDKKDFSLTLSVTPGAMNQLALTNQGNEEGDSNSDNAATGSQGLKIFISEFLPDPVGDDINEWIELYNGGDSAVDLVGWQIDDAEGGSKPYKFITGTKIEAKGYLLLPRSQTKIALNNTFDSVRLIDAKSVVYQRIDYQKPLTGLSYSRSDDSEYFWTKTLTPGLANIISGEEDEGETENTLIENVNAGEAESLVREVNLEEVKNLEVGESIKTVGTVILLPNMFAKSYFYLNGLEVYCAKADFPELKMGDRVQVTGTISQASGRLRLKIKNQNDIKILGHQAIVAKQVKAEELGDDLVDSLVGVSGQVVEKTGQTIYLDDGTGEVQIYTKPKIKIDKKEIKERNYLQAAGILDINKDGWRILPRFQNDLTIQNTVETDQPVDQAVKELTETKNSQVATGATANIWSGLNTNRATKYLMTSATALVIILIGLFLKLRGIIK